MLEQMGIAAAASYKLALLSSREKSRTGKNRRLPGSTV
jgi:hypothetical protein